MSTEQAGNERGKEGKDEEEFTHQGGRCHDDEQEGIR